MRARRVRGDSGWFWPWVQPGPPGAPGKPTQAAASAGHVELNLPGPGGGSVGSTEHVVTPWVCGGHSPACLPRWAVSAGIGCVVPTRAPQGHSDTRVARLRHGRLRLTLKRPGCQDTSPWASPPRPTGGHWPRAATRQPSAAESLPPSVPHGRGMSPWCPAEFVPGRWDKGWAAHHGRAGPCVGHTQPATSGTSLPAPHCTGGGRRPEEGPWGWGPQP